MSIKYSECVCVFLP